MAIRVNPLVRLVCMVVAVSAVSLAKQTPKPAASYFNLCRRGDPRLNECVKNAITAVKPKLIKGIPALNVVPIDPMVIPRMELVEGAGSFQLNTTLTNLTLRGFGDFTVTNANFTLDDKQFLLDIVLSTPELIMTSIYDMAGQILVIPIKGNGNCEMNYTDLETTGRFIGRVVTRGAQQFVQLTDMKATIDVNGKSTSWFYNLFNGDKRLGDATNKFLNDNSREAYQAIKHLPEEGFAQVFKALASNVLNQYPINDLFVD